ncbi:MAG: L-threonine 3-dehydrogenase [Gemmatimonadales bacterium]
MRAISKPERAPGLTLVDVPKPDCGPHDVLIRVRHAGLCGTDLHIAEWDTWAQGRVNPPLVLGHEFAGSVESVGDEVGAEFTIGQLVTAEGHIICGHCRQCRTGNGHICAKTQIIGVDRDGAFAEYIAMPATNVMPLNSITTEVGAVMDPLGNAFHTVMANDVSGRSVLILGCGPIGCFGIGVARAAGSSQVIASDVKEPRLNLARRMGAHALLDASREDVVERVMELTDGEGVDIVCEMSGHPTAVRQAFRCARLGGHVQLLGLPSGEISLDLSNDVIFRGLTIYGVIGRKMYETWHQMRCFLSSGLLDPTPVLTHKFKLEQVDAALDAIRSGEAGKVILEI